jgi:pyruvate kinase
MKYLSSKKELIRKAKMARIPVIVATQMMDNDY